MIIIIRDLQVLHCMKERRGLAMTLVISKLILVVLRLLLEIQLRLHWAIGTWNMHLWTVDVMPSCRVAEKDPVAQKVIILYFSILEILKISTITIPEKT